MRPGPLLDRVWQYNAPHEWALAAVIAVVALAVLLLLRRFAIARLGAVAGRTPNDLDDLAVVLVARTRAYFLLFVALYLATRALALPPSVDAYFETATLLILLLQFGLWGSVTVDFWGKRYLERRRASHTASGLATINALAVAAKIALWIVVLITALSIFHVNVAALVTSVSIGGVALALAVQNILGDVMAALAIVFDKPFDIGDFIVSGDVSGTVEHIGLKTTRIRSVSGEQVVIANGELLKSRIRNFKRMYERRVVFTTDVTYDTPADVVARIPDLLREIVSAQPAVRFDRSHFSAYTDSALRFETVYFVLDPDYLRYMNTQQAVNLELLRGFRARGIEFAFPTHSFRMVNASAPAGAAPAAGVQ